MTEVTFHGVARFRTPVGLKIGQVFDSFRGQHDRVSHSGHILARLQLTFQCEKLEFLREQEAVSSDAAQKFALRL